MIETIRTAQAPAAIGPYSQAKVCGGLVYVSGQIPLHPVSGTCVGETISQQTEQVMENIGAVLQAAGANFESVIKTTCFLVDMEDFPTFNEIYEKYFINKPARSCVAVRSLPKNVRIEVELVAEVI